VGKAKIVQTVNVSQLERPFPVSLRRWEHTHEERYCLELWGGVGLGDQIKRYHVRGRISLEGGEGTWPGPSNSATEKL